MGRGGVLLGTWDSLGLYGTVYRICVQCCLGQPSKPQPCGSWGAGRPPRPVPAMSYAPRDQTGDMQFGGGGWWLVDGGWVEAVMPNDLQVQIQVIPSKCIPQLRLKRIHSLFMRPSCSHSGNVSLRYVFLLCSR